MKAAIVDDIASATSRALVAGDAIWSTASHPSDRTLRDRRLTGQRLVRVGDSWTLASLKIEARLRAYFPDDLVADWQVYTWAVDRFINARRVSAAAALRDVLTRDVRLDSGVANAAGLLLGYGTHALPPRPAFTGDSIAESSEVDRLESLLPIDRYRHEAATGPPYTWRVLEKQLLRFQQAVDDQIVSTRAAGYSTTASDLIEDLVP